MYQCLIGWTTHPGFSTEGPMSGKTRTDGHPNFLLQAMMELLYFFFLSEEALSIPVVCNLDYSWRSFSDILMPGPHPHRLSFNRSGMWLTHLGVLKATQIILMFSGDWEPLVCKDMERSPSCTECRTVYAKCHRYVEDGKEEENIYIYS